jgi:electron transfer flavoprotein alpha subunit
MDGKTAEGLLMKPFSIDRDALVRELGMVTKVAEILNGLPADSALRVLEHARVLVADGAGTKVDESMNTLMQMAETYFASAGNVCASCEAAMAGPKV